MIRTDLQLVFELHEYTASKGMGPDHFSFSADELADRSTGQRGRPIEQTGLSGGGGCNSVGEPRLWLMNNAMHPPSYLNTNRYALAFLCPV